MSLSVGPYRVQYVVGIAHTIFMAIMQPEAEDQYRYKQYRSLCIMSIKLIGAHMCAALRQ